MVKKMNERGTEGGMGGDSGGGERKRQMERGWKEDIE